MTSPHDAVGDDGRESLRRPEVAPEEIDACRYRVFAFLFAVATILYHRWNWFQLAPQTIPLIAAFLVMLRPSSRLRFLVLAAIQLVYAYHDLPGANTNRTIQVFLSATIVVAWFVAWLRSRRTPSNVAWLRCFEPALRLQLLAIYLWAFWHKLNLDFFDLEKSCGVVLYQRIGERLPLLPLPTSAWALHAVVIGTVAVEGALPFLLLSRRTRNLGLVLGAALHFGFGLTMFYDFSMTMLALLFLFAPPGLAHALVSTPAFALRERLGLTRRQWSWLTAAIAVCGIVITKLVFWNMFNAFSVAWWTLPAVFATVAWVMRRQRPEQPPGVALLRVHPVMAVFALLVVLNGACPYIGSKTETAFAMYSNLRTEGGETNHLLLSRPLDWFDYQTDLILIESSSDPELTELAREGHAVPFYVLRKRVFEAASAGTTGIAISFTRGSQKITTSAAELDPELSWAPSYFELKFLRFRKILPADKNFCAH